MNRVSLPLSWYLEQSKIEQLEHEWQAKGYQTTRDALVGGLTADLVAKKGDETIAFEVKTSSSLAASKPGIDELAARATAMPKTSFRLVIVNPPRERTIEIEGIEASLFKYLLDYFPSDLDELSTHTSLESVDDVIIDDIHVFESGISVSGRGSLTVDLQYGSDSDVRDDQGLTGSEGVEFEFDVVLDFNLNVIRADRIEIDRSSFID